MAVVDREQFMNVEIKYDDKLNEADGVFIQVKYLFCIKLFGIIRYNYIVYVRVVVLVLSYLQINKEFS